MPLSPLSLSNEVPSLSFQNNQPCHFFVQMAIQSTKYVKGMLYSEFAAKVLQNAGPEILEEQGRRVYQYYNFRTGNIGASLATAAARVRKSAGGAVLTFDYAIDLRFLDMKQTKHGKKKIYGPVYNKPLWGYVYGYIFNTLRYGLTQKVQQEIFDEIRQSVEKLDTV